MKQELSRASMFYGADIISALGLDPNQRYVPITQLCDVLGLDRARHERRIRNHTVLAAATRRLLVDLDAGPARVLCLRVDLLPLWLAGLDATDVDATQRPRLELLQREASSVLWQSFRPQGFGPEDELLPERHEQSAVELAYVSALTMAILARHQMLIERQIDGRGQHNDDDQTAALAGASATIDDPQAVLLARAVRRVAQAAQERTRRNEYGGVYSGLFRQFGVSSYRRMPPARLREALEWLERWRGDLMGEPEPPPDIE